MEAPKATFHTRSISLPSTPTAFDVSIEDHLRRLRASQAGPSSSSNICQNLCSIRDLYEQMNYFLHLPHNQQALSCDLHRVKIEEILEGSLSLLDISSSALDALSQMKESILDLESALRRGSSSEGIASYMASRKKISKALSKCLVNVKKAEKCCSMTESGRNPIRNLKEAELISLSTLKSILSYLMGKKAMSQAHGWSLVAKLAKSKHVNRETEVANEVEDLDFVLSALSNKNLSGDTQVLLKQLDTLEMAISELHNGMDSVSRCFIKTRVCLLNVLN